MSALFLHTPLSLGGGFSILHLDGYGTVDSEHTNLHGFNEVVMLRRLPECHQLNVRKLWTSVPDDLYHLPHDNVEVEDMKWATVDLIKQYRDMK